MVLTNISGKGDLGDKVRQRYEQLKSQEKNGQLNDQGKAELDQLRGRFEHKDSV